MNKGLYALILALGALAPACPPSAPVYPDAGIDGGWDYDAVSYSAVDGGTDSGDVYDRACVNLRRLDCKEGFQDCENVMRKADGRISDLLGPRDSSGRACLENAATKIEIRACSPAWTYHCP